MPVIKIERIVGGVGYSLSGPFGDENRGVKGKVNGETVEIFSLTKLGGEPLTEENMLIIGKGKPRQTTDTVLFDNGRFHSMGVAKIINADEARRIILLREEAKVFLGVSATENLLDLLEAHHQNALRQLGIKQPQSDSFKNRVLGNLCCLICG